MKIGLCISGSFRGSALTIQQNLSHLREAGHEVTIYAFLRPEVDSLKVDWAMRRLPIIGYSRPWVSFYDFSDFRIEEIVELATEESWNFLEDSRTFDELLADYKLTRHYECAVAIGTGFVNSRKFHSRRFPNHFRNTFLMLHGIYESHKLLDSGGAQFDLVLRLRPDFLMSEAFVSSLVPTNNVIMPITNSGSLWDYGWGYASDMAFASSPGNMKALCEAILQVPIFWHEDRIRIVEKRTLPFIYGDAVFSYLTDKLNLTVHAIYKGGELIRPNKRYRFFFNRNYRKMKMEVKDNTRYLKQWRAWQTTG
jgi:hypothetical protein